MILKILTWVGVVALTWYVIAVIGIIRREIQDRKRWR